MRVAALAFLSLAAAAPATAPKLRFDQAFSTVGEPARVHYQVAYRANGAVHRLEVWRDGDRRVKRVTDGAIASFATHQPRDAGYALTVLDRRRRISTRVDRVNLYRVGQFTDWFDLGHGLRHPKAAYTLVAASAPAGVPAPLAPCRWYDLTQGGVATHICWSDSEHLPLILADAQGQPVWRVAALDHRPLPASLFVVDDRGYVRNDANSDISKD